MKALFLCCILLLGLSAPAHAQESHFEIERNATLETMQVMFLLTPSIRTPSVGMRPQADDARRHFAAFVDHPSVQLLDRMVRERPDMTWIDWLQILTALSVMSAETAPNAGFDAARNGIPDLYDETLAPRLSVLMQAVNAFYRDADMAEYMRQSQPVYDCVFAEIERNMPPPTLLPAMERYYGDRMNRYVMVPSPLINVGVNLGVRVLTPEGPQTFMLMGPNKVTRVLDEYGCGFGDPDTITWLTVHEFGHSFVNPLLGAPEVEAAYEAHAHLFRPIREEQSEQGMSTWEGAVVEHVVRLGELRVLEAIGDSKGAQARRVEHVLERKFIYLPLLEERIRAYEADRTAYPTFKSFLPQLLDAFDDGPATP